LLEAMGDEIEAARLFKAGRVTGKTMFNKTITPSSWKDRLGYSCKVVSKKDKSEQDLDQIQKLNAVKSFMPNNRELNKILQEKLLDMSNLTSDENKRIMEEEATIGMNPIIPGDLTNANPAPIMNPTAKPPLMATA